MSEMVRPQSLWKSLVALVVLGSAACGGYEYDPNSYFPEAWDNEYVQLSQCAKSSTHSGNYVEVWVNPEAEQTFKDGAVPFAEGTVFLKPQFDDASCGGQPVTWTVMRKGAAGTAPDTGDWEWQSVDENGEITGQGQIAFCLNCHENASERDYVWTEAP